ncbi:uncharacterized protein LOC133197871 [Saccostrea echinata]|uniref:uncharacterized protein LOC133197871 n=1 Tax=Saccostrea echinata TaxID=191078 RepID=UPI002A83F42E|nr:uncharacterized protein LOC133197871 [Saccostrea echinata]
MRNLDIQTARILEDLLFFNNSRRIRSITSQLWVYIETDPLKIFYTDQPSYITKGSEVHLTCLVIGGTHPDITWIGPLGTLPIHSHTTNDDITLVIPNFDDSHSGQYICLVSDGSQFVNHIFNLIVDAEHSCKLPTQTLPTQVTSLNTLPIVTKAPGPPHIVSVNVVPNIIRYGDNVVATCNVISYPPYDIFSWSMMVPVGDENS